MISSTTRWVIGLAPGSSGAGVMAALLEVQGSGLELRARPARLLHQPYPRDLRDLLLRLTGSEPVELRQVGLLHRLLGETFAAAARQVVDRASLSLQQVQCLGCPGQGVWLDAEGRYPSTVELGMASLVAEKTGITTVSDFRGRDLAAGGNGAPLEALADFLLFRDAAESRLFVHLGGLATVTLLPAGGRVADVAAFEAGPCNALLDALIRRLTSGKEAFDTGGKHAVQGRCLEPLLERWLEHPYWQRRPPRVLALRSFTQDLVGQALQLQRDNNASVHDLLCTATHLVVRGVVSGLRRFVPTERLPTRVLLSGGGVRNGLLWHLLEQHLTGMKVERIDALGVPADARKALGAGVLAALTLDGVPANLPGVTGAAGARLLGSLTPGAAGNWSRCVAWMAQQTAPVLARAA